MKQIIVDFLRRWWGAYLLAVLFVVAMAAAMRFDVGAIAAAMRFDASFIFVGVLMLPFASELGRRPFGVMATLPVSRRTIALSYWCLAVLLPVLLMAGIIMFEVRLFRLQLDFRSAVILSRSAAMILFSSLAFTGSAYCLFTFISQNKRVSDLVSVPVIFLVFLCSYNFMFRGFIREIREVFEGTIKNPVVYPGLIGLLFTFLGYLRSEKLVVGRVRKRPDGGHFFVQAPKRIPSFKPGMARFGGVLFDVLWRGFLSGSLVSTFLLLVKTRNPEDVRFWPLLFVFGAMTSATILSGGTRLLRSLPLSAGQLALTLLLMPLFSTLSIISGLAIIQWINPGQFPIPYSAFLMIPTSGAVCIAFSLIVPFGRNGHLLATILALFALEVIFNTIPNVHWPAAFWWLLGLSLMLAAFIMNRRWLRSSDSYRPSTGDFLQRQR